ncbi:MAG TPA: cbb3-type cytochrome c oxidase N-terminal domain-containing protein [Pedobacter sp.]|uniref:cbb3-type cytochrome c oxidase N-terminal domain-containing protein n=1 Tax=Pedobacter sp. TaxID=1411316 RepID=UPI002B66E318|nr:cbb3-type cytochrome c oxidase N-terminal domain-containing protein [Pedobacter sp.]HMI02247.1 cbb3-type cytochrome c oxidase N-terminal domain-containing protein [Pedobacter sp.]
MTDVFIGILLIAVLMVLMVSLLILKVIKVYVQETLDPKPFATPEEKEMARLAAEKEEAETAKMPTLWTKIMGLRPISEEKDLVMEHTFDGIAELDNPAPAWFMVLFYGTVIFAMVYLLSYHVFGLGMLQEEEYAVELKQAEDAKTAMLLKPGNAAAKVNENNVQISKEPAVLQSGAAIFKGACTPCHGEHAEGIVGPNLTDEYWLHGGTVKDIFKTIKYGVPEKGMIAWEKTLRPKQISELTSYILSLQASKPAGAKAPQGNKL